MMLCGQNQPICVENAVDNSNSLAGTVGRGSSLRKELTVAAVQLSHMGFSPIYPGS